MVWGAINKMRDARIECIYNMEYILQISLESVRETLDQGLLVPDEYPVAGSGRDEPRVGKGSYFCQR